VYGERVMLDRGLVNQPVAPLVEVSLLNYYRDNMKTLGVKVRLNEREDYKHMETKGPKV
jgi:hypothetical protein